LIDSRQFHLHDVWGTVPAGVVPAKDGYNPNAINNLRGGGGNVEEGTGYEAAGKCEIRIDIAMVCHRRLHS